MTEPTRGYIEAPHFSPPKSAWKEYCEWCRRHRAVRILVAKAEYWKVEIDARLTQPGRFDAESRRWFTERAAYYLQCSTSGNPRQRIASARMTVYGLSRDDARAFAAESVKRFPGLRGFRWPPLGTYPRQERPDQLEANAYRLSDGKPVIPSNVVNLAMKRKQRHPNDTDIFGMPRPRRRPNPFGDGPA